MGFSAQLLDELGVLQTPFGVLVTVTAVFDDVLSIVVLAEVSALAGNTASVTDGNDTAAAALDTPPIDAWTVSE
jgi:Kef-type K+ transport system membrane component KefB